MKRILYFFLLGLLACPALLFTSCSDDDDVTTQATNREFMTMFMTRYTNPNGSTDYPYNCGLDGNYPHGNTIHLYWYGVDNCAGYEIQMALQPKVSGGESAWQAVQGTNDILLDTIVSPDHLDMVIKDLQYSTVYSFAIRALSPLDNNTTDFSHASKWFGHGGGREWSEYCQISTSDRYETPYAVYVNQAETTENTMHVYLNSNISQLGLDLTQETDQEKLQSYYENFNIDANGNLGYKYLRVQVSPNNPNSTVGDKWKYYEITDEDRARGYVVVDGLTANSVYVIDVIDPSVAVDVDAKYNTCTARTDGTPGAPIVLDHDSLINAYGTSRADTFALAAEYNAAPISPTLLDFISNVNYAEGQTFYLDGGKTYYIDGNDITCKGFTLRTNPADVEKGLRARVICGIGKNSDAFSNSTNGEQWQGSYTMFMFGRQPEAGEGGEIYMKKLAFYDIDFDNPTAINYGDNVAGAGTISGNYFFNMYSDGMAVTLDSLVIENCTFKRCVRGFIREQGANYKVWNHVLIKDNQFFDCGYYNSGAGGYCWIDGSGNNAASNLYNDMKVIQNTFYDSPFPAFFKESKDMAWTAGSWNITFSNNTLVNFNTRGNGAIFKMQTIPDGSVYNVENNLIVITKQDGDQRVLNSYGAEIKSTQTLSDGTSSHVTLNFQNNWSTNNNLTDGQIFSASKWSATKNSFGMLVRDNLATLNGSLDVQVANVSATELFTSPNPPHKASTAGEQNMHRTDALDGTATTGYNVNLYYKNTNNDIYTNNVGDPRWRSAGATAAKMRINAHRR